MFSKANDVSKRGNIQRTTCFLNAAMFPRLRGLRGAKICSNDASRTKCDLPPLNCLTRCFVLFHNKIR